MNIRELFLMFSGLLLCLFQFSLGYGESTILNVDPETSKNRAQSAYPEAINADQCRYSSRLNLDHYHYGILQGYGYEPLDCEIVLGDRLNSLVISFNEHDLNGNDEVVFKDSEGTELSLTGYKRRWNEKKSFIFKGLVEIHYSTNGTIPLEFFPSSKFKFVFTKSHEIPCLTDEFECNNKQCIPNHLVCDFHNNCGDGSDEIDCEYLDKDCTDNEFKCSNRKCIPNYKLCDRRNDCGDNSDEEYCDHYCEQLTHYYKCNNSRCVSNLDVCNDRNDCGDWSDETNCYRPCDDNKFRCNNGKCIDSWKACNKFDECGDRSDEENCRECYSWEFRCSNRKCVPRSSVCNKRNDCGDNSDEKGCNTAERDNADQRKVTVVELSNPWLITIIVCAAVLAIVIVTFAFIYLRNRLNKTKKPPTSQHSNIPINTNNQNVQPPNLFGRIRHSFRSGGQSVPSAIESPGQIQEPHAVSGAQPHQVPSVYPQIQSGVENSDVHQMPPRNFVERVRQSFRSGRQSGPSSIQPPGHTEPPSAASGEQAYQVPSMYPHLQPGVDNPAFRAET